MKYPLKWSHQFVRETQCFFLGHKWKHSKTRHTQYYGLKADEVPYQVRKITGNYMWESVAWWSAKCTRCRYKLRVDGGDTWDVWYMKQYWAARDAVHTIRWHLKFNKEEYGNRSIPFKLKLLLIPILLAAGLKQYLCHFEKLPWSWWTGLADIESWYWMKLDEK